MGIKELGFAAGLAASVGNGAQANDEVSFNSWAKSHPEQASANLARHTTNKEVAQSIVETGEFTKNQIAQIQAELGTKNNFSFDTRGARNYIQADASYIHNNLGVGIQASHSDQVDQLAFTAGIALTPGESSVLSRVIENGQIKVSLAESEVKNALANFDETGVGIEVILNLKNAFLKQISIAHSDHDLKISDGSDKWRISGIDTDTSINTTRNESQTIQTTTTNTTTYETRNVANDVDQTAVQVLLGLTKDLDAVLSYSRDSLGESLSSADFEYRFNNHWSARAGYEESRRFSGAEKQDIKTATLNYKKGNWSAFAGLRDNGIDMSPYAGVQYRYSFGETNYGAYSNSKTNSVARSLTSPALGAREVHPHAIEQENRSTHTVSVDEVVDNLAKGSLSNITATTDSCSADFNVADQDGVEAVIIRLSNGAEKRFAATSGEVTFSNLDENTAYSMALYGVSNNGITNTLEESLLGSAPCKTLEATPDPETEKPTVVSEISGSSTISVGDTADYSITATDEDNGIASVTATINGSSVSVSQSGDTYSITLPASATASAGNVDIEFSVIGTKVDGSNDIAIIKSTTVEVMTEVVEDPTVVSEISGNDTISVGDTPSYSVTASDADNGIASVTATVDGSSVSVSGSGDTYSITLPASVTASAGNVSVVFEVTGTKEDGSTDNPITKTKMVEVEPVISTPMIDSIGTWDINDNGGGGGIFASTRTITGSDIQAGAVFSIVTPTPGLTIDASSGVLTFDDDVNGNQSFPVTVKVKNPDTGEDLESFTLNVTDNA